MCKADNEDINHLILECPMLEETWRKYPINIKGGIVNPTIEEILDTRILTKKHTECDDKDLKRWEDLTRDFLYALYTKHAITKNSTNTYSKIQNPTAVETNSLVRVMVAVHISS